MDIGGRRLYGKMSCGGGDERFNRDYGCRICVWSDTPGLRDAGGDTLRPWVLIYRGDDAEIPQDPCASTNIDFGLPFTKKKFNYKINSGKIQSDSGGDPHHIVSWCKSVDDMNSFLQLCS